MRMLAQLFTYVALIAGVVVPITVIAMAASARTARTAAVLRAVISLVVWAVVSLGLTFLYFAISMGRFLEENANDLLLGVVGTIGGCIVYVLVGWGLASWVKVDEKPSEGEGAV
jgi:hypothetical protein